MSYATTASTGSETLHAWRRTPLVVRVAVVALAAVLGVELVSSLVSSVVGSRTTPQSATSPYATGPSGTAAFVQLLDKAGDHVSIVTSPVTPSTLPASGTLIVLDPRHWSASDAAAARAVAVAGGRVVFVGAAPARPGPALASGTVVARQPGTAGPVTSVATSPLGLGVTALTTGLGRLVTTGDVRDDVRASRGVVVASSGSVVWVASSAPLQNRSLARLDNAALALNLTRPHGRDVVLDAANMNAPSTSTGLLALPSWWRAAIVVALAAVAVWLASAARRFGPLEPRARELAPPRVGYAEAIAALLDALPAQKVQGATAPVHEAVRRELGRMLRVGPDATGVEVATLGAARGIPEWVVDVATSEVTSRDDAVEAGRALAWLHAERSLQ